MKNSLALQPDATPRKRLAPTCLPEKFRGVPPSAGLTRAADETTGLLFECIEATASKFKLSDKEMSDLLRITQSNYSRRSYNTARVQFLGLEMRRYFTKQLAKADGLHAEPPTEVQKVKAAAKQNMLTLLELMEAL